MNDRIPAEVFPPGEILRDELEARGWSEEKPWIVNDIVIAHTITITDETARALAAVLGTSPEFWMNLQSMYSAASRRTLLQ